MYSQCLKVANNNVLRNGFVKLIDIMPKEIPIEARALGCDSAVVQAARVSYAKGLKDTKSDIKLINYLYKHKHTSPFEMVKFKFHVKAPIFVARQWFRHRMGNYNEISGRYTVLNEDIYLPIKIPSQNTKNKQLSNNDNLLNNKKVNELQTKYMHNCMEQFNIYQQLMSLGVSREVARIGLPLNLFTEFYWSIDLHNLLNFIKLRNSDKAQFEIKEYARNIEEIVENYCPITINAFRNNKQINLSIEQINSLKINSLDNLTEREKFFKYIG
jgi:thymidylate synthase (FAD)